MKATWPLLTFADCSTARGARRTPPLLKEQCDGGVQLTIGIVQKKYITQITIRGTQRSGAEHITSAAATVLLI